ncbi:SsgA family sporulation/cell division regulator [Streptomyces sp. NPDC048277]|uniref:SsgA family sporulation/cell division regulator n=1 Tax=Streptomyces sp. NPDC048277 TaxID=3155027 RepID=UPI0033C8DE57
MERDCPDLDLTLWLHVSLYEGLPVGARFSYDTARPFEVNVDFSTAAGGAVTWVLSRELLMHGLVVPSGEGDIRVFPPCRHHGGQHLFVLLRGRIGEALLEIDCQPLQAWLVRTLEIVAFGAESESFDWDGSLERVLAEWSW